MSGLEQTRLGPTQYHAEHSSKADPTCHEEGPSREYLFKSEVNNLGSVIASMNIPFHDTSHELVAFDSHDCLNKEVVGLTALLCIRYITGYAAFV